MSVVLALGASTLRAELPKGTAPVAIVQDVEGVPAPRKFELLRPETRIGLGVNGRIVLGYLNSCWQDTIVGGHITIRSDSTDVENGDLYRQRVECDLSGLKRTTHAAWEGPRPPLPTEKKLTDPDIVLFGLSPIILAHRQAGRLVIDRLDASGPTQRVDLAGDATDLADANVRLQPEGVYRITLGSVSLVARIDVLAEPGHVPAIGRLLIFP
jgi:hypothetical protein